MILLNQHYKALAYNGAPPKGGMPSSCLAPETADMGSSNPPLAGAVSERQSVRGCTQQTRRFVRHSGRPLAAASSPALFRRSKASRHRSSRRARHDAASLLEAFSLLFRLVDSRCFPRSSLRYAPRPKRSASRLVPFPNGSRPRGFALPLGTQRRTRARPHT